MEVEYYDSSDCMMAFPGMLLGTEEEYISGEGTFVENGKIYSNIIGEVKVNDERRISIVPQNMLSSLRIDSVVYGRVEEIFEPVAIVKLQPMQEEGTRQVLTNYYVTLHVSNIRNGYVDSVKGEVRVGDIIKARIAEIKKDFVHISIRDRDLGVIKAFCSNCRAGLSVSGSGLKCSQCGIIEKRKVASYN